MANTKTKMTTNEPSNVVANIRCTKMHCYLNEWRFMFCAWNTNECRNVATNAFKNDGCFVCLSMSAMRSEKARAKTKSYLDYFWCNENNLFKAKWRRKRTKTSSTHISLHIALKSQKRWRSKRLKIGQKWFSIREKMFFFSKSNKSNEICFIHRY